MTTSKARVVSGAPFGDLEALGTAKAQIDAGKLRFRVINHWGSKAHS